jgi:putative tryptophan/tyrosine transport system substrate-binding protein
MIRAIRAIFLFICLLLTVLLLTGVFARAQQPKKIPRIGLISVQDSASESARAEAIRRALRERGYVEGQNIAFEYRYADGKRDRLPQLAAELVRLQVNIIVVGGGVLPLRAAKNATQTIPIIMVGTGLDPVKAGLVDSLARPGGNITGLTTSFAGELVGKQLELLKEAVPKLSRVAVLYDPINPSSGLALKETLPVAARSLKLAVHPWEVRTRDDFDRIFASLNKERPDGLHVLGGGLMSANQKRIAGFALKSLLPSIWGNKRDVEAGGLMSYGAELEDSYRRVAYYVDRILKGAKPGDLPVEQPTKFELVINLKTAKQIGLTIPPNVLGRADRVIK